MIPLSLQMVSFLTIFLLKFISTEAKYDRPDNSSDNKYCIGIDLGTTYSCISAVPKSGVADMEILEIAPGFTTLPSIVKFEPFKAGQNEKITYVAKTGWEYYLNNMKNPSPNTFLYAFKRYMGISSISDEPKLRDINKKVTYSLVEQKSNNSDQKSIYMQIKDVNNNVVKNVSAIDASAYILEHLMEIVHKKYGKNNIENVIITVPAYFNEVQVQATKTSAAIANFEIKRTVNEPVAAAYAYQIKTKPKHENIESYLVFDFGGGTLDISILEYESGVLEVVTYSGSNFCGGENINDCLFLHFKSILTGKGVLLNDVELLRLRNFTEKFKINYCNKLNDEGSTDNFTYSQDFAYLGDKVETFTLSNREFKKVCKPIIDEIQEQLTGTDVGVLWKYSKKWGKDANDVEKVLLVGGSTRVPFIKELLSDIFGEEKVSNELDPDTSVAEGAALYAANMSDWLKDDSVHLIDVVPMNIGICVDSDTFESILDMESAIPATQVKTFTTGQDNQTMVKIKVAQGARYQYHKNQHLGQFELSLKNPQPRGVPQIEVSISINKERDISVKAVDKATGKEESIKFIKQDYELSDERRKEMLRDRENNKSADEKLKQKDSKIKEIENFKDMVNATVQKSEIDEATRTNIYKSITKIEDFIKDAKNPMSGISPEDIALRHKEFEREVAPLMGMKPKEETGVPEEKAAEEKVPEEKAREEL